MRRSRRQTIGRRGLERRWERELRGQDGRENIAVNARGQHLGKEMDELLIPESERLIADFQARVHAAIG